MNWLTNFVKPKLSALVNKRNVPDNLWRNCPNCGNMLHHKDLFENFDVCNKCDYHFRMSVKRRIEVIFDKDSFKVLELDNTIDDPLSFTDTKKYKDRISAAQKKTGQKEALLVAQGQLCSLPVVTAAFDFNLY